MKVSKAEDVLKYNIEEECDAGTYQKLYNREL